MLNSAKSLILVTSFSLIFCTFSWYVFVYFSLQLFPEVSQQAIDIINIIADNDEDDIGDKAVSGLHLFDLIALLFLREIDPWTSSYRLYRVAPPEQADSLVKEHMSLFVQAGNPVSQMANMIVQAI